MKFKKLQIFILCGTLGIFSKRACAEENSDETPTDTAGSESSEPLLQKKESALPPTSPENQSGDQTTTVPKTQANPSADKKKRSLKRKKKKTKNQDNKVTDSPSSKQTVKDSEAGVTSTPNPSLNGARGLESVEFSGAIGLQLTAAKGLLFNQADSIKATGTRWGASLRLFPFTKLGESRLYRSVGIAGYFSRAQTFSADVKDDSVGSKVGSFKLDLQEKSAGLALRLGVADNKFILNAEFLPYFKVAQTPMVSGPLSKAAVINYESKGFGTMAGVEYISSESFTLNVKALFASSLQGSSTNVSVDELSFAKVTLQKASYFRLSEQTKYYFKHIFFSIDLSFSSFDVTIPNDYVPSRSISQRNTAACLGLGASF